MGRGRIAALAIAAALLCGAGFDAAVAQGTMNDALTRRVQAGEGKDRLLLEAKEIVYDNDNNTVSAVGDVELYYQGRTLQADRVTYDLKSGRVVAQGNARMVEANGAVITGDRFDLTLAAAYCDRVALLHEGRLAGLGTPREVLTEARVQHVYGPLVTIIPHPRTGLPVIIPAAPAAVAPEVTDD